MKVHLQQDASPASSRALDFAEPEATLAELFDLRARVRVLEDRLPEAPQTTLPWSERPWHPRILRAGVCTHCGATDGLEPFVDHQGVVPRLRCVEFYVCLANRASARRDAA